MDKALIDTLAKVIIAAAWADNEMTSEENSSLKDLLFEFHHHVSQDTLIMRETQTESRTNSELTSRELAQFELYTSAPVGAAEREQLVNQLRETVWSDEDKTFILSALKSMVEADGKITEDERAVLNEITEKIEAVDTGVFGDLGRLIRGAMQRRSESISKAPNREEYFEDFLKNKVYYEVRRRLNLGETNLEIPDEDLRKLSIIAGLMVRVAQVDNIVLEKETENMMSILQGSWNLSNEAASFVIEVATSEVTKNFDYLRMTREFLDIAAAGERANLLHLLFAVANADGKVSNDELKEVRNIADYLLLSNNRVDEAYSKTFH